MQLPFAREEFFSVFAAYNVAVWPAQTLMGALAVVACAAIPVRGRWGSIVISAILAGLWAWLALGYHLAYFSAINPLAYVFAAVSIVGSVVFFWHGVVRQRLVFRWSGSARSVTGVLCVGFALVGYPAWALAVGHRYPAFPTFGLPCPTTLFTIGLLCFLAPPCPRSVFVVPILWSLVGGQAAFLLGVPQDQGLFAAAIVGITLAALSGQSSSPRPHAE